MLALCATAALAPLRAQAPSSQDLAFDVASIRLNPATDVPLVAQQVFTRQQRVQAPSATVRELIRYAYDTCQGSLSPQDPISELPRCPLLVGPHPSAQGARLEMGNVPIQDLAACLGNVPVIDELVVDRSDRFHSAAD